MSGQMNVLFTGSMASSVSIPLSSLNLQQHHQSPNQQAPPQFQQQIQSPTKSLPQQQHQQQQHAATTGNKSMVQVIVSAPNLDSFTASPSLLRMASSLMENPTIAELINTPCETSDAAASPSNGNINIYGMKGGVNSVTVNPSDITIPDNFYYRDPRLPEGWYVGVEGTPSGHMVVYYYTSSGEKLRSLSEVSSPSTS